MELEILDLQELCFEVIIEKFSRYIAAYESSIDECIRKCLLFLQKTFSERIFQKLDRTGALEEQHLSFLLNEYLKKVDLGCLLKLTSSENVLEKVIPIGHSVAEIYCIGKNVECKNRNNYLLTLKELIPHVIGVKKIFIGKMCDDDLLKLIAAFCPQLTELDISLSNVTGEGLKYLYAHCDGSIKNNRRLRYLNSKFTKLSEKDVAEFLKNVPSLEEVMFAKLPGIIQDIHQNIMKKNLNTEVITCNLTSIDFSEYQNNSISKLLQLCVDICPLIKKLSVHIFEPKELELCCSFSKLEDIAILSCGEEEVINELNNFFKVKGTNLKCLRVCSSELDVSVLMESCSNLESLSLEKIEYRDREYHILKPLLLLRRLEIGGEYVFISVPSDPLNELLTSCPKLETLSLFNCNPNKLDIFENFSPFFQSCKLKNLHFDKAFFDINSLKQLISKCLYLRSLSLSKIPLLMSGDDTPLKEFIKESNRRIDLIFEPVTCDELSYEYYEEENYGQCRLNH